LNRAKLGRGMSIQLFIDFNNRKKTKPLNKRPIQNEPCVLHHLTWTLCILLYLLLYLSHFTVGMW